jgi:hypothetical protein
MLEPVQYYDEMVHTTYFMLKMEPKLFLIALFNERKKKGDPAVVEWIAAMATNLRNYRIFEKLVPKT